MVEIENLIKKVGLKRVLEELIFSLKETADTFRDFRDVDYLDKAVENLSKTLTVYESRNDNERDN